MFRSQEKHADIVTQKLLVLPTLTHHLRWFPLSHRERAEKNKNYTLITHSFSLWEKAKKEKLIVFRQNLG